jgi:hypothetical protein
MHPTRLIFRTVAVLALSVSLLPARAAAGSAPAVGDARPELTVTFVPVEAQVASPTQGESFLDLGALAASRPGAHGRASVRQRVGVRVESPTHTVAVARLQVYLATETPGCTVRVDGVTLTAIPRTLDRIHRVGTTVVHEVEVIVPPNVPAGPFASAITWVAESL